MNLVQTVLSACSKEIDKCEQKILGTDTNMQFLKQLTKKRVITAEEQQRVDLINQNLTRSGSETLSTLWITKVCPVSGECVLFGEGEDVFSKWADIRKGNIVGINAIGGESSNGFVREIKLTNQINNGTKNIQYDRYVILKSNKNAYSDNLWYEWYVGQYLNKFLHRFPLFCKTYGIYEYTTAEDKTALENIKEDEDTKHFTPLEKQARQKQKYQNALGAIQRLSETSFQQSYTQPENMCIVVQHVHKAIQFIELLDIYKIYSSLASLSDADLAFFQEDDGLTLSKNLRMELTFLKPIFDVLLSQNQGERKAELANLKHDILCILYQIYFVLPLLEDFSHNDLHLGNVILTPAGKGNYYQYNYTNDKTFAFQCRYVAKIIDYGRCFFRDEHMTAEEISNLFRPMQVFADLPNAKNVYPNGTLGLKQRLDKTIHPVTKEKLTSYQQYQMGYPWELIELTPCVTLDLRIIYDCIKYYKVLDASFLTPVKTLPEGICKDQTQKYANTVIFPNVKDIAPTLETLIDQTHTYPGTLVCTIHIHDKNDMRVVWANIGGRKRKSRMRKSRMRKSRKT